jgi:hypothetical protein
MIPSHCFSLANLAKGTLAGFMLGHMSVWGPIAPADGDLPLRDEPVARWRQRRLQKRAVHGWRRREELDEWEEEEAEGQETGERLARRELKGVLQ